MEASATPIRQRDEPSPHPAEIFPNAVKPGLCLVVDDSRVVRKVARRILELHGFTVDEAVNGQDALDRCRATLPHFVLLDWHMPVMDGLEFLRLLRAEFGADRPMVLFCTTANQSAEVDSAFAAGAQGHLMKPFDEAILVDELVSLGLL